MSNCKNRRCIHEWCDRNRTQCDALVPLPDRRRTMTTCGKKATWLAPMGPMFPLSYCDIHRPAEVQS